MNLITTSYRKMEVVSYTAIGVVLHWKHLERPSFYSFRMEQHPFVSHSIMVTCLELATSHICTYCDCNKEPTFAFIIKRAYCLCHMTSSIRVCGTTFFLLVLYAARFNGKILLNPNKTTPFCTKANFYLFGSVTPRKNIIFWFRTTLPLFACCTPLFSLLNKAWNILHSQFSLLVCYLSVPFQNWFFFFSYHSLLFLFFHFLFLSLPPISADYGPRFYWRSCAKNYIWS